MEMIVIAVVAVAAFAAVLVPLFRRRPGFGDPREFENIPEAAREQGAKPTAAPTGDSSAEAAATDAGPDTMRPQSAPAAGDELELEVERYRAAVRADTVCRKCGQANPADSAFCFECGAALPRADAKEFE